MAKKNANAAEGIEEKEKSGKETLGRLKSFGLKEPWQVALLLPNSWEDLGKRVIDFDNLEGFVGHNILLQGKITRLETKFDKMVRLIGRVSDHKGNSVGFSRFGDTRDLQKELEEKKASGEQVHLFGELSSYGDGLWLKNPDLVHPRWVGRLRPVYPGKANVITPETVRERVVGLLPSAVGPAIEWMGSELAVFGFWEDLMSFSGLPETDWTPTRMIFSAHLPKTLEEGFRAQAAMSRLAALGVASRAMAEGQVSSRARFRATNMKQRLEAIPFQVTEEQRQAVVEIWQDLRAPEPMRRILAGDVGTGKSCVYGLACCSVVDGGGRTAVLLPNESLAKQQHAVFRKWWPDLDIVLVTGETGSLSLPSPARFFIGTTALLHRDLGGRLDLLVVDEQQKFATEQREKLLDGATNLLEVTATCIPRSQALIRYGVMKISRLRECHVQKEITTRIWERRNARELLQEIKGTVVLGGQVLLVYPKRELDEEVAPDTAESGSKSVEMKAAGEAYKTWEPHFPGRIRLVHGQMSGSDKDSALNAMRHDDADVLIATSVVEVGIDLPKLKRVVVVQPERHGLTTLHQIRGRVARTGGRGWCDLYLPSPVKQQSMARLEVLVKTSDGFEVAEHDMRLRGIGDITAGGEKQSGSDDTWLFGRPLSVEDLDWVLEQLGKAQEDLRGEQ